MEITYAILLRFQPPKDVRVTQADSAATTGVKFSASRK
jgi:hypothetical protein